MAQPRAGAAGREPARQAARRVPDGDRKFLRGNSAQRPDRGDLGLGLMLRRTAWAALGLAVALWPATLPAQEPLELKLKAAFLYNFARLATWPSAKFSDPAAPLEACILDDDPLAPALQQAFAGKVVDGHPLAVRRLPGIGGWERCHL